MTIPYYTFHNYGDYTVVEVCVVDNLNGTAGPQVITSPTAAPSDFIAMRDFSIYADLDWPEDTSAQVLQAAFAAARDREYWRLPTMLPRRWTFIPKLICYRRRLMVSISGWLARVAKKRKSGN